MSSEQYREQGIQAAKARRTDEARQLLQQALRLNPRDELAWLYLASVARDTKERLLYLQKVLEINPQQEMARKAVEALGITVEQLLQAKPGATSTPATPAARDTSKPKPAPVKPTPPPAPTPPPDRGSIPDYLRGMDDDDADESDAFGIPAAAATIPDYLRDLDEEDAAPAASAIPDYLRGMDDDDEDAAPAVSAIPDYLRGMDDDDEDAAPAAPLPMVPAFDLGFEDFDETDFGGVARPRVAPPPDEPAFDDFDDFDDDLLDARLSAATASPAPSTPASLSSAVNPALAAAIKQAGSATGAPLPVPPRGDPMIHGVPVPDEDYLRQVLLYLDPMIEGYQVAPESTVEWVRKESGRAGERDILTLRLQIAGAVAAGVIALLFVATLIVLNVPGIREVVFVPTRTPTLTPSATPTITPGFSPTPSPTLDTTRFPTYTPSPTLPLILSPVARLNATARPTDLGLPVNADREIIDSAQLIAQGQYEFAIGTLEANRAGAGNVFNPNPYYFEAVALARSGDSTGALDLLLAAENTLQGLSDRDVTLYGPLINLGYAEVFLTQALDALDRGSPVEANQRLTEAQSRLEEALTVNPRLERALIVLSETYRLQGAYPAAIQVVDEAVAQFPELIASQALLMQKGEVFFSEAEALLASGNTETAYGQFQRAEYQAYFALYLNPYLETAHQLRVKAALARQQPGQAVLYLETYQLYYPNSLTVLRYLGLARGAEGNDDLAALAFSQAIESGVDTTSPALAEVLVARATLYEHQQRYDLALADYNRALEITPDTAIQAKRMLAAYQVRDFTTVLSDADALTEVNVLPPDQLRVLRAQVLVDRAPRNSITGMEEALDLLAQVNDAGLPAELAAVANQYRAIAHFRLKNLPEALAAIDASLAIQASGSRHYLRGQIQEELGNFAAAVKDYEWILAWDTVYGYDFTPDVLERLPGLRQQAVATATAEARLSLTPTATP